MPDATDPIREAAVAFPEVAPGTACTQSSFQAGKGKFLFIGPGRKADGGHKAMFRLNASMEQALNLADEHPDRFEVGSTGWVTVRFTDEDPLPESVWRPWLEESYGLAVGR